MGAGKHGATLARKGRCRKAGLAVGVGSAWHGYPCPTCPHFFVSPGLTRGDGMVGDCDPHASSAPCAIPLTPHDARNPRLAPEKRTAPVRAGAAA